MKADESTNQNEEASLRPYQLVKVDEETGENAVMNKYLYFEGRPREYRFNGQSGQFNLYGDRILTDEKGRTLMAFSFQPIAYRIFEDTLFGRTVRELWAEIFFIDNENCVSSIMFNNTSVSELYRMMEPILYERQTLCDVLVTVRPEKVFSKSDPTRSWFIARFSYETALVEKVREMREFTRDCRIYRSETLTSSAQHKLISRSYYNAIESLEDYSLGTSNSAKAA
ncbi:hypothetical protein GCM10027275_22780 [Rhabdobacter roseus]|uniref:Uncharacterized protein n=1 Tax=Rhabdobacter roseus TaxID=1655419 RepID=A0A840TMQ1_9BACT|nr:hypothetical protein [Rhabdobacter roseus]MBB5284215.1 hypothetical protein [Rhabdobacter roseus]